MRAAGSTLELPVAGRAGVSPTASSVVLNVTVDAAREDGFVTVFPCDAPRPNASNLNYVAGITIPNAVVTRIGAGGTVCLYTFGATHLIVDVAGVFSPGSFNPLAAPQRVLDSRPLATTADGLFAGSGVQPRDTTVQLKVAGRVGVPADASAVVLNVTAVNAVDGGFVTVLPARHVAAQRVEPQLRRRSEHPERGHHPGRPGRRRVLLHVRRDPPDRRRRRMVDRTSRRPRADRAVPRTRRLRLDPAATECARSSGRAAPRRRRGSHRGLGVRRSVGYDQPLLQRHDHASTSTPGQVAAWAQSTVAPYFAEVSRGRYSDHVHRASAASRCRAPTGPGTARTKAEALTGAPYTNVLVTDTRSYGGGFASPGLISTNPAFDKGALVAGAPNQTRRARGSAEVRLPRVST